jgi:low temperature requirement protein LtrA
MRVAVSGAPGAEGVVTPLELFFDLVYVFAIGQLSHHLLEHVVPSASKEARMNNLLRK